MGAGYAKFTGKENIWSVWRIKEPSYNFISQVDILWNADSNLFHECFLLTHEVVDIS